MASIALETGLLKGKTVEVWEPSTLADAAEAHSKKIEAISFYRSALERRTFRGITFSNCNFARSRFKEIVFRKCTFKMVDFTRTTFIECYFSECAFIDCDPYHARFRRCAIDPSEFKNCYSDDALWNKALLLFSTLRQELEREGNGRMARVADYYYRVWERRRLHWLWKVSETSSRWPWLRSLLVSLLTGYGERPAYVGAWMLALITTMGCVYWKWFPFVVSGDKPGLGSYWYFSFKIFCAQGFASEFVTTGLLLCQVVEFSLGLFFIALLVGSVTRKLSS
jgi:uncharacterized protein YjbI with pentapeptide repeats